MQTADFKCGQSQASVSLAEPDSHTKSRLLPLSCEISGQWASIFHLNHSLGISELAAASYTEDSYGVVQRVSCVILVSFPGYGRGTWE